MEIPQQQQAVHDLTVDAGVGMHPSNQPPFPAAAVAQPLLLERGSSALSPVRLDADSDEEGEGGDENSASPNVLAPHRAAPPPVKKPDTPYLLEVKIPGQKLPRGEAGGFGAAAVAAAPEASVAVSCSCLVVDGRRCDCCAGSCSCCGGGSGLGGAGTRKRSAPVSVGSDDGAPGGAADSCSSSGAGDGKGEATGEANRVKRVRREGEAEDPASLVSPTSSLSFPGKGGLFQLSRKIGPSPLVPSDLVSGSGFGSGSASGGFGGGGAGGASGAGGSSSGGGGGDGVGWGGGGSGGGVGTFHGASASASSSAFPTSSIYPSASHPFPPAVVLPDVELF